MAVLPTGIGPVTGYQIERSLRFNSADNAFLNRTPASASNRKTWTWSGWVKRSKLGAQQGLIACPVGTSDSTYMNLQFTSGDLLGLGLYTQYVLLTTQVFRDASAWYHIVVSFDTTNATANNRCRMYVNGVEITTFTTRNNPTQNADYGINAASQHDIGRSEYTNSTCLGGYLTEVNFIDGSVKTPSDFGETDTNTGVWKPKAYSGTYGTNGFYLKFADNSGTTSTTLGKDSSGNGNNWTPNNFSVTAGVGNDSLVDSPTSYGTDTGVGGTVRGNYATYNSAGSAPSVTLTNGNLDASHGAFSSTTGAASTFGVSSGKWYWEVTINAISSGAPYIGIVRSDQLYPFTTLFANNSQGYAYRSTGVKRNNSTDTSYGASYTSGDVIGVALDMDAGTIVFYKNNTSQGTAFSSLSGTFIPIDANGTSGGTYTSTINFGQRAFAYTAPSGFKALCTQNLPTPTIGATSTTQANRYFDIVLYQAATTNGTYTHGNLAFRPDFTWIKNRDNVERHFLIDVLRGNTNITDKFLVSNSTAAEGANGVGGTTFSVTDTGYQFVETTINADELYFNNRTYAGWNWKANGAGSTNTAGNITSTVSVSTASGFSIVTYTGNGSANQTVGHGLGVAPAFGILKDRDPNSNNDQWQVFHTAAGDKYGYLSTTAAFSGTAEFYPTSGSSTTVTIARGSPAATTNESGDRYVMYLFAPVAGYSAFGSYTGNGNADGPFVYTGFRPRWIMWKNTTTAGYNWEIIDTARDTYNVMLNVLGPNSSLAESSFAGPPYLDALSNGFKVRTGSATSGYQNINNSGDTYIYAAFAESPFKYALAR